MVPEALSVEGIEMAVAMLAEKCLCRRWQFLFLFYGILLFWFFNLLFWFCVMTGILDSCWRRGQWDHSAPRVFPAEIVSQPSLMFLLGLSIFVLAVVLCCRYCVVRLSDCCWAQCVHIYSIVLYSLYAVNVWIQHNTIMVPFFSNRCRPVKTGLTPSRSFLATG